MKFAQKNSLTSRQFFSELAEISKITKVTEIAEIEKNPR